MWPWEHLALGYLLVSLAGARAADGVDGPTALAVAVATQLPDLIDKPLAWTFGVLPSGLSLGHSLLFAVPLSAAAIALAARWDRPFLGVAVAIAYGSHLFGDLAFAAIAGGGLSVGFLLWPLVPAGSGAEAGFLSRVGDLATAFWRFLSTPTGQLYLLADAALLLAALWRWVRDGYPGLPTRR